MAHRLSLEITVHDDGALTLGAMVRRGRTLTFARVGVLLEPYTPQGASEAARAMVRSFLSPELAPEADEALVAVFEALTQPF